MKADVIAIDGPAASGKSSVAKEVARSLGALHINTGSMYRAVAWKALSCGVSPERDPGKFSALLRETRMEFVTVPGSPEPELLVDGAAPGEKLRTPDVSEYSSRYAVLAEVRARLVELQREMAGKRQIVMEGRDIGTAVFPDAKYKFFLTASPLERARRRLLQDGKALSQELLTETASAIAARDRTDSTRKLSPLRQAPDAMLVDSTALTLAQTVQLILGRIQNNMVSIQYRVPYADTDQMGVVYYANYYVYFERCRNELLRGTQMDYRELEDKGGIAMPVIESRCFYRASAKYDDLITVTGRVTEAKGVRVKIECEVLRGDEVLTTGYTVHACIDMKSGRPVRVPEYMLRMLEPAVLK